MPVYLVAEDSPFELSEEQFVSGLPLQDLVAGLSPRQHLYLVDYASVPGRTRLTRLV